ncbi:unnamed protein product [Rotaria socialis]|uniref:NHL repeat-containing protein n=1 Tax=Rotaria socialis TaxID=392032 RepID=A0A820Q6J0_9BILA|nr:unnamed protein product [Rotaria socialis]
MGTFYVADYNNHRIVRWFNGSTSGNVIMAEQGVGIGIPQVPYPYDLAFGRQGNLYVTELLNSRIRMFPIDKSSCVKAIGLPIDRLISIKFPSKSKHILTKRVTLMTILFIYIFSIVYCTPYLLEQSYVPELKQCHLTNIVVFYISTNFLLYFVFGKKIRLTLIQYVSNIFSKHPQSTFTTINLQGSNVQKTIADDTYQSAYNENQITLSTM